MATTRRSFNKEYKLEAVKLLKDSGKSLNQQARDLGIDRKMLARWRTEFSKDAVNAFRGNGRLSQEQEELRGLRRENETLKREREILKKVLAIVSEPSPSTMG